MYKNDCIFFITLIIRREIERKGGKRGKEKDRERKQDRCMCDEFLIQN